MLRSRWAIIRKQAQFKRQLEEADIFYRRKMVQCQKQIEFVDEQLKIYLQSNNNKSLSTPDGTFFLRKHTSKDWGEEPKLLEWAKINVPEAVKTTETVNKTVLQAHAKKTGEVPPDYSESTETILQVRE